MMTDLEAPSFSLGLDSDVFDSDSEPPFTSFKDNNDDFETLVVQDSDPHYPDPHPNLHRLRRGPTVSATSSSSPSHVLHSTAVRHTDEHLHTQHNVGCTSSNEREAVTASCCNAVFPKLAAGPVREFSLTDSDSDCYDPVVGRKCKRKQNVSNAWGDSPKAYRYFFHDDIRIQELVQSRLPNFFPLGNMLNIDLERSGTSEIDYMGQFRFGKSSKQTAGTIKEKNSSNGRKNSRKLDTDEMSQGWVNPKLGVDKVRAKGAVKRKVHTARQSAGHWLTGSDGKKVYFGKSGQELTGRVAYMQYKKESGSRFRKVKRKSVTKKKK